MNRPTNQRMSSHGFTLMEILLAMAVSAMVLSVISTVYFGALQLRNRSMESYDRALPLEHTLMILRKDLAGVMPPGGTLSGELQSVPTNVEVINSMTVFGNSRQVGPFLHTASGTIDDYTPFADVRRVGYFLATPTNGTTAAGWDLYRVDSGNLLPASTIEEASSRWLMGGIEEMFFQYYDGTSWLNDWDSETSGTTPEAIKVQLVPFVERNTRNPYLDEPVELVVPLVIKGRPEEEQEEDGGDA